MVQRRTPMIPRARLAAALASLLLVSCAAPQEGPNILIITLDTTRADHLAPYGYRDIRTPFVGALAARGIVFESAFTPVPITLPSHATMMTGQYPATHGVRDNGIYRLGDEAHTLAEVLREAGYHTGAVVGSFVLDGRFGLAQGFDSYDDALELDLDRSRYRFQERRAGQVTDNAIEWLRGRRRGPFFLWVHYYDPHAEYDPPPPYDQIYHDSPYDGEIAYVDEQIGRLLKELVDRNELTNTVVTVVGDHGEGLWEHGEATHGIFLYDSTIRVPLIMAHPAALPRGLTFGRTARTVDLMPTLLSLAGIDPPPGCEGEDLLPAIRAAARAKSSDFVIAPGSPEETGGRSVLLEQMATRERFGWSPLRGIRTERFKYIDAPAPELYDLSSDPYEYFNIVDDEKDTAEALRLRLEREFPSDPGGSSRRTALDSETEERLRALGYVWGPPRPQEDSAGEGGDPKALLEAFYLVTRGRGLWEEGLYDEAAEQYDAALAIDPGNYMALIDVCLLSLEAPGWRRTADRLEELLEDTEVPALQFLLAVNLGNVYFGRGHLELAERHYERARSLERGNPIPLSNLGLIAMTQGRFEESQALYEEALAADPDLPDPTHYLGLLAEARGHSREAERIYRRLLKEHPEFVPAMNSLAWLWAREGRNLEEAAELAERAVSENPRDANYLDTLGWVRYQTGDYSESVALLERATALHPANAEIRYHLALAYLRVGRTGEGVTVLRGAVEEGDKAGATWVDEARAELASAEQKLGNTGE